MKVAYGKGVSLSGRIAYGKIKFITLRKYEISARPAEGFEAEAARFETARRLVIARQEELYEEALEKASASVAQIFEAHIAILCDEELLEKVRHRIAQRKTNAMQATLRAFREITDEMLATEETAVTERIADVRDVANLLLDALAEAEGGALSEPGGALCTEEDAPAESSGRDSFIMVAEDLTPSETLRIDRNSVCGVILRGGSVNSHVSILLRSMGIPALVQCEGIERSWDGMPAVIDSAEGTVYIEPDERILNEMRERQQDEKKRTALLSELKDLPSVTPYGRRIRICANIESPEEAIAARENGAEGIGLLRTEFLFMNRHTYPDENEQYEAYRKVLEAMKGMRVVIRTIDIGADKTPSYMQMERERNPVLGLRSIRLCLARPELFRTQLRAILRAAACGDAAILFPMIISVEEVRKSKALLTECGKELSEKGIPWRMPETGVMIETPAAALIAEDLAKEVDFFSIGTNDLLQYTCAVDRGNGLVEYLADPMHPALQRLIRMTVEAAHGAGIPVAICGELGADLSVTDRFLAMGVDEISVHPVAVLPLRGKVRSMKEEPVICN